MIIINKTWIYATVFIVGATTLAVEILGTRTLGPFYGSTVFVWSSLISVTMLGLALGYMLSGYLADHFPKSSFLYIYVGLAGIFVIFVPFLLQVVLIFSDQFGMRFGPLVAASLLYLPIFILCGLVAPLSIKLLLSNTNNTGKISGKIYAFGTAGSLFGALVTGFFLLPLLAISKFFLWLGLFLLIFSIISLSFVGFFTTKKRLFFLIILLIFLGSLFLFNKQYSSVKDFSYHAQSFYGDIKFGQHGPFDCLYVNGLTQTCLTKDKTTDAYYIEQISQIVKEKNPQNILLIGLAGGAVLTVFPDEVEITAIELDPQVVLVAKEFGLFPQRDIKIIYDDGRHYLETTKDKFDFVIIDIASGSSLPPFMFTVEAFQKMKSLLSNNSVVFINTMLLDPVNDQKLFGSVTASFRQVFITNSFGLANETNSDWLPFNLIAGDLAETENYYLVNLDEYSAYTQTEPVYDDKISVYFKHQSFLESIREQLIKYNTRLLMVN